VNAKLYVETLLPKQVAECRLQDSSASVPKGRCICTHCMCGTRLNRHQLHRIHRQGSVATKITGPESTEIEHYHYHTFQPKPKSIHTSWQSIWDELPQNSINKAKAMQSFTKSTDYEHVLKLVVDTLNILC